jgi:hypothetical protein
MIGKFDYTQPPQNMPQTGMRQQQGEMSTFVRLTDEKEVYVVNGFLRMNVSRDSEAFRDKNLTGINWNDISRISFDYPDQIMTLESQEGKWALNNTPVDSMKMVRYLSTISRLTGQEFVYEHPSLGSPSHTVTIEGNNFTPIEIKAYPMADTNINYVLISSKNPEALFSGKKGQLFEKVMKEAPEFFPDPE